MLDFSLNRAIGNYDYNEVSRTMQAEVDLLLNGEERDANVLANRIKAAVDPLTQEGRWW